MLFWATAVDAKAARDTPARLARAPNAAFARPADHPPLKTKLLPMLNLLATRFLLIAAVTVAVWPGASTAQATVTLDAVVALVEEDVVLRSELDDTLNQIRRQFADRQAQLPPTDVLERQVLDRIITTRLQLQRAESMGVRATDAEVEAGIARVAQQNKLSVLQFRDALQREGIAFADFREQLTNDIVLQKLRNRLVQSRVAVTESEIDNLLANGDLRSGEVRLADILLLVPEGASVDAVDAVRNKTEAIRAEISAGMPFADAAARYSQGQQALEGGDLGWRPIEQVPALFVERLARMAVGEVSEPIRTPSGFHLIKLVERRDQGSMMISEYRARHVLVKPSELRSESQARARIAEIEKRARAGEDFAELAQKMSDDELTQTQGGDLGWFQLTQFGPDVARMVQSMSAGDITEPFQTELGFHILKLEEVRTADRSNDILRNRAREAIVARKSDEELNRWVRQLRSESFIEIRLPSAASG